MLRLRIRVPQTQSESEINIGRNVLTNVGDTAARLFPGVTKRVVLISNQKVFSLYGAEVMTSLVESGFEASTLQIGDGERFKSLKTLEYVLNSLHREKIDRSGVVIALGGGVVGDVTGLAASVYLRGIGFLQIPTTLLSQVDSSVGGKTGVNLTKGKNLVGTFYQPRAVIIDTNTLRTLPARELSSGWFETVKQGAVGGRDLFDKTVAFLRESGLRTHSNPSTLIRLIRDHLAFKISIVTADERESMARRDKLSRKILNFGHTVAHAIETSTRYRRFRHGEAVGYGMLAAATISKNLGLLTNPELELLRQAVGLCGTLPSANDLSATAIIEAIAADKKRTSGSVQWVLLEGIGKPKLVDGGEIKPRLLKESLRSVLKKGTNES